MITIIDSDTASSVPAATAPTHQGTTSVRVTPPNYRVDLSAFRVRQPLRGLAHSQFRDQIGWLFAQYGVIDNKTCWTGTNSYVEFVFGEIDFDTDESGQLSPRAMDDFLARFEQDLRAIYQGFHRPRLWVVTEFGVIACE
ncbi:MAG TPA: hypothetical protein VLF91_03595 [Candidatus Saccharimonadales bacterium]|nr:hypothetical protein [Candidatus Saccharimonadales bacterium]